MLGAKYVHLERLSCRTDVPAVGTGEAGGEDMPRLDVFAHDGLVGGLVGAGGAAEPARLPVVHLPDHAVQLRQLCN
jgi:hypothetical protein